MAKLMDRVLRVEQCQIGPELEVVVEGLVEGQVTVLGRVVSGTDSDVSHDRRVPIIQLLRAPEGLYIACVCMQSKLRGCMVREKAVRW